MRNRSSLRLLFLTMIALASIASPTLASDADVDAIKSLIRDSYVHGAFNDLNPEAMKRGFHPDFAIFSARGEDIAKYPIATWAEGTAKRKADPEFDPAGNVWEHRFAQVDVTGGSAMVKIELSQRWKARLHRLPVAAEVRLGLAHRRQGLPQALRPACA